MKARSFALLLVLLSFGCPRPRRWVEQQDPSVRMPGYDAIMAGASIDGPSLRALEVAANDYFPAGGAPRACIDTPEAHRFYAVRSGDVIYVAILQDPAHCGRAYPSLDAGARYAISADGRLLRRLLAGEPDSNTAQDSPRDGGSMPDTPGQGDGGASIDVSIPPDARVSFPGLADAGTALPDAGMPSRDVP